MKIKQTMMTVVFAVSVVLGVALYNKPTYAAPTTPNQADQQDQASSDGCGGAKTSIIKCSEGAGKTTQDNGVWALLMLTLNIMTAGVGILAVGGIAYGAALYASSSDKPEQAKQGMTFIKNVVIGLVAYGLMYVLLNFLIPGGIFT
jgi:hypothetical protein